VVVKSTNAISRLALAVAIPAVARELRRRRVNLQINVMRDSRYAQLDGEDRLSSDIADVVVAGPQEVLVNGKKIGLTTLVIWDDANNSRMFNVTVRGPFSDQKIELRVKLAEVNRQKALDLGFNFFGQTEHNGATYAGSLSPVPIPNDQANALFSYIKGTDQIAAAIKALETNGVLKILAEPTVIAASGEEAHSLPAAKSGARRGDANGTTGTQSRLSGRSSHQRSHSCRQCVTTPASSTRCFTGSEPTRTTTTPSCCPVSDPGDSRAQSRGRPWSFPTRSRSSADSSDHQRAKIKKSIPILGHIPCFISLSDLRRRRKRVSS
jgi:hypothetical protein